MIAIVNVTDKEGKGEYGKGTQTYEVRINYKVLFKYTHKFEDGIAECLYKAANAAKKWEEDGN